MADPNEYKAAKLEIDKFYHNLRSAVDNLTNLIGFAQRGVLSGNNYTRAEGFARNLTDIRSEVEKIIGDTSLETDPRDFG